MTVAERYQRYVGPEARARGAQLAGVVDDAWMQDWPLEVADTKRMEEFITLAEGAASGDDRLALLKLVLHSLDLCDEFSRRHWWCRVQQLLESCPEDAAYPVLYWSCLTERDDGHWEFDEELVGHFHMTTLARRVLPGTEVRFHYGAPHMIVVSELSEDIIKAALDHLCSAELIAKCSLPIEDSGVLRP